MKQKTQRKFAAFDIDGTLFRSGLYRQIFYELISMKVVPTEIAEEAIRLHRQWRHRVHGSAFEEFERFMVDGVDGMLKNLRIDDYDEAVRRVLDSKADDIYVYTRNLLRTLQQQGYFTIAISGSQHEIVEPFAGRYSFDAWIGQYYERGDEFFTGKVLKTHTGKDEILRKFINEHNLSLEGSYAVGDTNGDAGMLKLVENPIAFNPTDELYRLARQAGWKIVVERKNVIYELESHGDTYLLADPES